MRDYAAELPVCLDFDLKMSGWNGAISPYPGIKPKQFAMQSIRSSLMKKFMDRPSSNADAAALSLFLKINEKCKSFTMDTSGCSSFEAIALGEAKDFIYRCFFPDNQETGNLRRLTLVEVSKGFGLGSGANIGSYGTDFLSKVGTSHMSATSSRLHVLFKQAISSDPLWSSVESSRLEFRGSEVVQGSRLSFVPKTTEISRTICTEPILNMLFQKGIASVLEGILEEVCGIDLRKQPDKNRVLAQLGSVDGRFGTIDLSSASDSMSIGLVKEFFPKHVFDMLEMTRCPLTTLPGGANVELHMISSMGNAFTFPLQTIFFTAIVYGAYRALSIDFQRPFRHSLGNFAVFGDDIICDFRSYDLICRLLSICGFSVNINKSFNQGLFRESCGHDYFHGHNVRGVYIKSLKALSDKYSAINRLNRWSALWEIPLPNTIHHLLIGTRLLSVPFDEMDDAGIKVPLSYVKNIKLNRYTGGVFYRFLYRKARSYDVTDVELKPPNLRGWINNPQAVLLAALAGTLRRGKVTIRSIDSDRPSFRTRYSSRWDYIPSEYVAMRTIGARWKSFVELNLSFYKV